MKKIEAGVVMILAVSLLAGCGAADQASLSEQAERTEVVTAVQKTKETSAAGPVIVPEGERDIAFEAATTADYNRQAMSLGDLARDSDVICRFIVQDTKPFINENGMICTEVSPYIEEVYKGDAEGLRFCTEGGEMPYEEYMGNETVREMLSGHEDPDGDAASRGKYARETVDHAYIMHSGEEYIYFGSLRNKDTLYPLYGYQGTFRITGDHVENEAIPSDDALGEDLMKNFPAQGTILKAGSGQTAVPASFDASTDGFTAAIREEM